MFHPGGQFVKAVGQPAALVALEEAEHAGDEGNGFGRFPRPDNDRPVWKLQGCIQPFTIPGAVAIDRIPQYRVPSLRRGLRAVPPDNRRGSSQTDAWL